MPRVIKIPTEHIYKYGFFFSQIEINSHFLFVISFVVVCKIKIKIVKREKNNSVLHKQI